MKRQWLQSTVVTVVALFAFPFQDGCMQASQVRYSWSGTMLPISSDDPWLLGEHGKSFEFEVAVSHTAFDLSDVDVKFAAFVVDDASLFVEGAEITYVSMGVIDFTDDSLTGYDFLVFAGLFEHFGHTIEVGSAVTFALTTFQFSNEIEAPPFFESATNVLRTTYSPQGPYAGVVSEGATVLVAPEPTSIALSAAIATCIALTCCSRCDSSRLLAKRVVANKRA